MGEDCEPLYANELDTAVKWVSPQQHRATLVHEEIENMNRSLTSKEIEQ